MAERPEFPECEQSLPASAMLHRLPAEDVLGLFEDQDREVFRALTRARSAILALAERMHDALNAQGRVFYVGAGTSGRLGVLDAAEWPPTFGLPRGRVVALLAGGRGAFHEAVEGAEDRPAEARQALGDACFQSPDLLVGISASGGAPYVRAAVAVARQLSCARALITTNSRALDDEGLLRVVVATGPEVVAGSTRLKAAIATHLVLQRASTLCAVRLGWIYAGHMVEMRPTNAKLQERAARMVSELGGVDRARAERLLAAAEGDVKIAIVCARHGLPVAAAADLLECSGRRLDRLEGFA